MGDLGGFLAFSLLLFAYFLPSYVAYRRKSVRATAVGLINLFFGWTLIGWIVALIIANSGISGATHIVCPDCNEFILKDARVCKHCGARLIPESASA